MENRFIYLDNAATTKPCKAAADAFLNTVEHFGNPSSLYRLGLDSEKIINSAKDKIASRLGIDKKDLFFTSGGTEANNTAVFGAAYGRKKLGNRIITTAIEHPSVLECFKRLENEGFDVHYLTPDSGGRISLDELDGLLNENVTLVSVMHANNETGVIQPVDEIKALLRSKSPKALLHCDCVQSFGKIPTEPKKWGADLISISAHKINGFKGTGALYIKNGVTIKPLIVGGEQQREIRPGTENLGGIAAFGAAAECYEFDNEEMKKFRTDFADRLMKELDDTVINGSEEYNSGAVLNISFCGIKAEILLHSLESKGIYVSTGSACSSHKPLPSHVLTAMGKSKREINGAIRFSFDRPLTEEETEYAVKTVTEEVKTIRRYI